MATPEDVARLAARFDVCHDVLPNRAYLMSFRDQTLVARRLALEDAIAYRDGLPADAGTHDKQLGLLGLIGEAMQVIEDIASLGRALVEGIAGVPFYAPATVFSDRAVNNFWSKMKNQPPEYILRLVGLRLDGRPLHELMEIGAQLQQSDVDALLDAEVATERLLREHLVRLARVWDRYGHFFRAFKHGAILINPDDIELMEDRQRVIPVFAAWRRHRDPPEIGPPVDEPTDWLADEMIQEGRVALDVGEHLVDMRLAVVDHLRFADDGSIVGYDPNLSPWSFWFRERDVRTETINVLRERFGIVMTPPTGAMTPARQPLRRGGRTS